jgi:hypothetical protein
MRKWFEGKEMIYIPSLIKVGSGIQRLLGGGGYTDTQTAW